MKNKKIFIIIISSVLIILITVVLYILLFRNRNIQNLNNLGHPLNNNQNSSNLELEDIYYIKDEYTEEEKNAGLNIQSEGIKYCYYEEECFKEIFLSCQPGNYIHFINETSPYNFMIMSKYENNCLLLIQDLKNTDSKNINCSIPLTEMIENTLNKFLSLNQESINKYCK